MNELFRRDEKIVLREVSQAVIYGPGFINGCAAPTLHYHRKKNGLVNLGKKIWHDLATIKQVSLKNGQFTSFQGLWESRNIFLGEPTPCKHFY